MQEKDQTHHLFKIKQIKKKYCEIMVVYVKINKKYIEVNEHIIIVLLCYILILLILSFKFFTFYFAKQFHFNNKMTF